MRDTYMNIESKIPIIENKELDEGIKKQIL